jgi:tRNA dimethylallyltransferase
MSQKVIAVAGPTASGKTSLAIDIALKLKTEIINCDSRQLYKELNIGVARPSVDELNTVKHHFVAEFSIFDPISAGMYAKMARKTLTEIIGKNGNVVVCGGTGLYLKALLYGFDNLPHDAEVREEVNKLFSEKGIEGLRSAVSNRDTEALNPKIIQNPARLKRILELLIMSPGKKLAELRRNEENPLPYPTQIVCINYKKEELYSRINNRVDDMIATGLKDEVFDLFPHRHLEILKTVGYQEFFRHFEGELTEFECINLIKQHTRNYAKRQVTWFKNQTSAEWIEPKPSNDGIFAFLNND